MPPRKRIASRTNSRRGDPIAAVEEFLADNGVDFVRFEQSDTHGIALEYAPRATLDALRETDSIFYSGTRPRRGGRRGGRDRLSGVARLS